MITVELTEGEARALMYADAPEAYIEEYPYHLLERAQDNVRRALNGEPRLPDTGDELRLRPNIKRLIIKP